jgi:hypothetical protein
MTRQILKIDKLLELMNHELSRFDTCVECRFKSVMPLGGADESGCNWSHANLNCRGYPAAVGQSTSLCQPSTVCQPVASRVIAEARKKYNVW